MTNITAKSARAISRMKSVSADDLFIACQCSVWTTAISGSDSIAQDFDQVEADKARLGRMMRTVAKRLEADGFKVQLGAGGFIDIDWSKS